MRIASTISQCARVLAAMGLGLCCLVGCKKPPAPAAVAKAAVSAAKTNAVVAATNETASEYVSVFEDLLPPKGRDPFFPNSHRREPAPPPNYHAAKAPVAALLVLKGIVGSANRRLAVINNATLETGEESSVRVPDGHVRVRCLEIGEDYVLIKVEGEGQPKRLELGKKE
ncbi:MAG: hypothetical protein ABSH38_14475 [Verrucomicrobiota bacterium]|jgi:hypothetical protein